MTDPTEGLLDRPELDERSASCPKCGALVTVSRIERHVARELAISRLLDVLDDEALEHLSSLVHVEGVELEGLSAADVVHVVEWPGVVADEPAEEVADAGVFDAFADPILGATGDEARAVDVAEPAEPWAGRGYPRR